MNGRYPIYIPSKGRWESRLTMRCLDRLNVHYRVVIEQQEHGEYARVIDANKLLVLPFSNLGQGSIPARNWIWEHSIKEGHERHWCIDDNIRAFYRLHHNEKVPVGDGTLFRVMEDFTDRWANVPMSGPNYHFFVPRKRAHQFPVFLPNTRIYSCTLLSNRVMHRWRGRYNEDTDLSLRFLKDGFVTVQFNLFLAAKTATMTMKGGNTTELYRQDKDFDGRLEMARSLQRQHPDVVRVTRKWGRWQHLVDYRPFDKNRLILKPGVEIASGADEYGMELRTVA